MDAGKLKIDKIAEAVTVGPQGQPAREVVITFHVGTHGPFTERFPAAPFDPNAANLKLQAFATALGQLNSTP